MHITDVKVNAPLSLEVFTLDSGGTSYRYLFEPSLITNKLIFINRYRFKLETGKRTYDMALGDRPSEDSNLVNNLLYHPDVQSHVDMFYSSNQATK